MKNGEFKLPTAPQQKVLMVIASNPPMTKAQISEKVQEKWNLADMRAHVNKAVMLFANKAIVEKQLSNETGLSSRKLHVWPITAKGEKLVENLKEITKILK